MKNLILPLICLFALTACQQEPSSQDSTHSEGPWLTDFEQAKATAQEANKLILLDFTGSDWCPPCKALHRNVLSKSDFLDFAKDNLVLVEVDFPRSKSQSASLKKHNQALAKKFNIEGYPTIILLDSEAKELMKEVGYQGDDPKSFIAKIEKFVK